MAEPAIDGLSDIRFRHGAGSFIGRLENQTPNPAAEVDQKGALPLIGQDQLNQLIPDVFIESLDGCHASVRTDAKRKRKMRAVEPFHWLGCLYFHLGLDDDGQALGRAFGADTPADTGLSQHATPIALAQDGPQGPLDFDTGRWFARRDGERAARHSVDIGVEQSRGAVDFELRVGGRQQDGSTMHAFDLACCR